MWYDSHCHVSATRFDDDRDAVLQRARDNAITIMINIGCEIPSWESALAMAEQHPDIFCSLGLHPHEAKHWDDEAKNKLRALLQSSPNIVAIGEMGLDFYYDHSPRDTQAKVFHEQLDMAKDLDLPAVFHIRDSHELSAAILAEHEGTRGIVHCFTGGPDDARRYLDLGLTISFSGIVTYKSAKQVQAAAKLVPKDLILIETDCPYLAPVPKRGKRNEPAFVAHTGEFLAKLKDIPKDQFAAQTRANTRAIFRLPEDAAC